MAAYEMFDEMTASIQQDTLRLLYHVRIEQKVEREQVAQVTGTNKDDSGPKNRCSVPQKRYIRTIRAHVEAERNTNSAVAAERNVSAGML